MCKFTANELQKIVNARIFHGTGCERFSKISTDTRTLGRGDLFVGIRGDRCDGNDFAEKALEMGALGVVTDRLITPPQGQAVFIVDDTNFAYMRLGKAARDRFKGKVFGITGSAGKTTTKDMLAHILSRKMSVVASKKSFNNFVGVPATLLETKKEHAAAIIEMGTNSPGEIAILSEIVRPHVGIITNIGKAHVGGFGSIEATALEKSSLLSHIEPFGKAVLNADNHYTAEMIEHFPCSKITFGQNRNANFRVEKVAAKPGHIEFKINAVKFKIPVLGVHNAMNAAAAVAGASLSGVEIDEAAAILSEFAGREMRMEITERLGVKVVNDAYNANPESMKAALDTLATMECSARRVAVLGDMQELGFESEKLHLEVAEYAANLKIDLLIFVGKESEACYRNIQCGQIKSFWFEDGREASVYLSSRLEKGDIVLFKGSRGMGLEKAAGMLLDLLSTRRRSARRSA